MLYHWTVTVLYIVGLCFKNVTVLYKCDWVTSSATIVVLAAPDRPPLAKLTVHYSASHLTPFSMATVCLCLLAEPLISRAIMGLCLLSWAKVYLTEPLTPLPSECLCVPSPLASLFPLVTAYWSCIGKGLAAMQAYFKKKKIMICGLKLNELCFFPHYGPKDGTSTQTDRLTYRHCSY